MVGKDFLLVAKAVVSADAESEHDPAESYIRRRAISGYRSSRYGSPYIAQRIANLTLDAMLYLYANEFSRGEREQKVGTLLWPDWHYGVLSMYGTHMAVNHLLVAEKLEIKKADQLLDQSTTNKDPYDLEKNNRLHLHCWHTEKRFSKFQFKAGTYNQIHPRTLLNDSSAQAYVILLIDRSCTDRRFAFFDRLCASHWNHD